MAASRVSFNSKYLFCSATALSFKRQGRTRFTALGCQDGFLQCTTVDMESLSELVAWPVIYKSFTFAFRVHYASNASIPLADLYIWQHIVYSLHHALLL